MSVFSLLATADISQVMNNNLPLSERLSMGLQTLGLGMGVVFASLIIIYLVCELMHRALNQSAEHETTDAPTTIAPAPVAAPVPAPASADLDPALIAVITAAVAATLEQPTSAFRVVSFRRTGRAWNAPLE